MCEEPFPDTKPINDDIEFIKPDKKKPQEVLPERPPIPFRRKFSADSFPDPKTGDEWQSIPPSS